MKARYKLVRFPEEAWRGFNSKKNVMNEILREELKKNNVRVSLADTLRFFSQKPVFVYNEELISFLKKNKKIRRIK